MIFWKAFKRVFSVLRLRKCKRKTSAQFLLILAIIGAIICSILMILFLWFKTSNKIVNTQEWKQDVFPITQKVRVETTTKNFPINNSKSLVIERPMKHVPLNEIYPDNTSEDDASLEFVTKPKYMIETNGCQIPVAMVPFNRTNQKLSCGHRAITFRKTGENQIQATIKVRAIKKYLKKPGSFNCCYKFFSSHITLKDGSNKTIYTKCKPLNESEPIALRSEFLLVKCFQYDNATTYVIYKDAYTFVKKINTSKASFGDCKERYNILVIGMESMSLSRFEQTMPRTTTFLKDNYWLGYRAFNKIEADIFPNLIATMSGLDMTDFSQKCANNMTKCNEMLIWSKFKEAGYVTAYGEDFMSHPETFSDGYEFYKKPTNHYLRSFFLNEEHIVNHSLVCAGRLSSGEHILNYALDFALTYRSDSFFGLFWIRSFSHSANLPLIEVDKKFENFFNQLTYTGVSKNTFVLFMSGHGILVGRTRLNVYSFYDERMPILFMLPATQFNGRHVEMYNSAIMNQGRLVTPYHVYNTLATIKQISLCENSTQRKAHSESCPKCQSLIEKIDTNLTCRDVGIHEKWCACRKLYNIDTHNDYGVKSVLHVVSYMKSMIKSIETKHCWNCKNLSLKTILRLHFYYDQTKVNMFYIVAFSMTPGDLIYEATVAQKISKDKDFEVVGPVSLLSDIKSIGNCTKYRYTRPYCLCVKQANC